MTSRSAALAGAGRLLKGHAEQGSNSACVRPGKTTAGTTLAFFLGVWAFFLFLSVADAERAFLREDTCHVYEAGDRGFRSPGGRSARPKKKVVIPLMF